MSIRNVIKCFFRSYSPIGNSIFNVFQSSRESVSSINSWPLAKIKVFRPNFLLIPENIPFFRRSFGHMTIFPWRKSHPNGELVFTCLMSVRRHYQYSEAKKKSFMCSLAFERYLKENVVSSFWTVSKQKMWNFSEILPIHLELVQPIHWPHFLHHPSCSVLVSILNH